MLPVAPSSRRTERHHAENSVLVIVLNCPQYLADGIAEDQIGIAVIRCFVSVDKYEFVSSIIANESRRRIDRQRCAADDEHLSVRDHAYRALDHLLVEAFFI